MYIFLLAKKIYCDFLQSICHFLEKTDQGGKKIAGSLGKKAGISATL